MAKKAKQNKIGAWAFLIGVILALILSIFQLSSSASELILGLLVIVGILIGLFNVGNSESSRFLLAAVSLVIVSFMGQAAISALGAFGYIGSVLVDILKNLLILFVPATIIVALRSVFEMAKD